MITEELRTHDGWSLTLRGRPGTGTPALFVHGYGMNGSTFWWHPSGVCFADAIEQAGFSPFSIDTRGTSTSVRYAGAPRPSLADQAWIDLPLAIDAVTRRCQSQHAHVIGCSLGGSLAYALAGSPNHRIGRLVTMGAPLVWQSSLITRAFRTLGPALRLPMPGTRKMAGAALPVAARFAPGLLSIYLNAGITDLTDVPSLVETVENPIGTINSEIVQWMRAGRLHLDGVDVAASLGRFQNPLLVLTGSGDGICPRSAATPAIDHTGGPSTHLEIGHPTGAPVGHADLFVSEAAPLAFEAVTRFLREVA